MRKRLLLLLLACITLGSISSIPLTTHAETLPSQSVTLSPASTQLSLNPGDSITKSFDVINAGSGDFDVALSVAPYYVTGTDYDPHFTQLPGTTNVSQWVTLATTQASVKSQKVLTTSYTVKVPPATAPGGYYAVIFAETTPHLSADSSGVVSHNRVGDILYITVNGTVKTAGSLTALPFHSLQLSPTVSFGEQLTNTGGVHFETNATMTIKNLFGQQVFKKTYDRIVLPQTSRNITDQWSSRYPVGIYTLYRQATVAGTLDTLPPITFVVVSIWFLIGIGLLLLIIIALIVRIVLFRRHKKAATKEKA